MGRPNHKAPVSSPAMQTRDDGTGRDHRLDKAKGLLIALVVLGHFLEQISGWAQDNSRAALTAIYSFHMPAFILLAGITAKSTKLFDRILVFVVLVVTAQPIYRYWVTWVDSTPDTHLNEPYWITWFLLAMVWWFLLLPLVERFPRTMLALSITIGVLGGVLSHVDYQFTIGRAMTFLPFFVIGKLYGMRLLRWAGSLTIPQKTVLSVLAVLPIAAFHLNEVHHRWLYGAQGFAFFDVSVPHGAAVRVCVLGSALLTTIVLLAWSQHLPDALTVVGQRSLAIFLFHGLIVKWSDEPLNAFADATTESVAILGCIIASVLVTAVLTWAPFDRGIRRYSSTAADWLATLLRAPFPQRGSGGRQDQSAQSDDPEPPQRERPLAYWNHAETAFRR